MDEAGNMGDVGKGGVARRLWHNRLLWFAVLGLSLIGIIFFQAGRYVAGSDDLPVKADLIVSLGGDPGARVRRAHQLYVAGYAPRILLAGFEYGIDQSRPHDFDWRAEFLSEQRVSHDVTFYDDQSGNTWEEAINTRRLMEKNGWKTVLVVSDPPHMRRLSWVWGKVFGDGSMSYRLVAAPMPEWDADRWWRHEVSARYVFLELLKLGYYRAVY